MQPLKNKNFSISISITIGYDYDLIDLINDDDDVT